MRHRDRIRYAAIALVVGMVLMAGSLGPIGANRAGAQVPPTPGAEDILKQLLGGLAGGAAGGGAQPAPSAAPAPATSAAPVATPVAAGGAPASQTGQGRILFQDPLTDNRNGWAEDGSRFYFQDGWFHIANGGSGQINVLPDNAPPFDNFSYEVTLKKVEGADGLFGGLIFRRDDQGLSYRFLINSAGDFGLDHRTTGNTLILTAGIRNPAIHAGEGATNRLKVVVSGTNIALYANEVLLDVVQDDTSLSGRIGVYAASGFHVAFSDVVVRAVEPAPSPTSLAGGNQILFQDSLATNVNGRWSTADGAFFAGGQYHLISPNLGQARFVGPTGGREYDDFSAEVTVQKVEGRDDRSFGFEFRRDRTGEIFYLFVLNGAGESTLFRHTADPNQAYVTLTPGTRTNAAINRGTGAINRLKVVASGPRIDLYANDAYLATVEDATQLYGRIAIFTSSELHAAFSNLTVRSLPR
jgi:hypothetical protein